MPAPSQKIIPFKGNDLDNDPQYVSQETSPFLKDITYNTNSKTNVGTQGEFTPNEGAEDYAPLIPLPAGINQKIGDFHVEQLGQTFLWYWNSVNEHTMWRIIGKTGQVQLVKQDPNFKFKRDPQFFISEGRCTIKTTTRFNKALQIDEDITFAVFTNNDVDQFFICIEDCIATNGFTGAYFNTDPDAYREDWLKLGLGTPLECIKIDQVRRDVNNADDQDLSNTMKYKGWQFRVKGIDVWGRETEHGFISDKYFPLTGNTCIGDSPALPRCVDLTFKAGSPFIDKWQVEFRRCNGNVRGFSIDTDWYLYDTFDKYDNCNDNLNWWERTIRNPWIDTFNATVGVFQQQAFFTTKAFQTIASGNQFIIDIGAFVTVGNGYRFIISGGTPVDGTYYVQSFSLVGTVYHIVTTTPIGSFTGVGNIAQARPTTSAEAVIAADKKGDLKYDIVTNTFRYRFCNSKECTALPVQETNRTQNPLPLISSTVFSIGNVIGLGRNVRQFEPLDCNELDKIDITVTAPVQQDESCQVAKRKIILYGYIKNIYDDYNVPIRQGADEMIYGTADGPKNNPYSFEQFFPKGQAGFVGYLAGTKYYSVSIQYRALPPGQGGNPGPNTIYQLWDDPVGGGSFPGNKGYAIQRWEFDVIPGAYIFRVASHNATPLDDYQSTSECLGGFHSPQDNTYGEYELQINTCFADFISTDLVPGLYIKIWDLTREEGKGNASSVSKGYMREDEKNKRPIEFAKIETNIGSSRHPLKTDHNGFFWGTTLKNHFQIHMRGKKSCVDNQILATGQMTYDDFPAHYRFDYLYAYHGTVEYPDGDRIYVKGKISLCDNPDIGVSGAAVVLTNCQWAITDSNGNFTIIAHDNIDNLPRTEQLLYTQRGPCQLNTCVTPGCAYCFPLENVPFPSCIGGHREYAAVGVKVRIRGFGKKGPQMGGRYGIGMEVFDWLGRHTFIQIRDKHYVDIPSLQKTRVFDFSTIGFSIDPSFTLPSWVRKMAFYITENLNWDDFITLVAERVQFIDNTGYTNTITPTQIRLYYENLNEYNKQNNFTTNYTWQFLTQTGTSVLGDQIEFLINGDNTFFADKVVALAKFDLAGKYIQIEYTEELKNLKDGVLLKIIRPKQCQDKNFFYSMCPVIDVKDGKPTMLSGNFNYFDSFLLNRQLPVPVLIVKKTTDPTSGQEIETSTTENKITDYPYLYEHNSPSDFWGSRCWNKGWPDVINQYEHKQHNISEYAFSKAFANNGILNGLNYFSEEDIVKLNEQQWGGIVASFVELNYILTLCEKDNFVVMYDDNTLRLNRLGQVIASSAESLVGKPERKIGNNYGCDLNDVNTIRKRMGLVVFLDRSKSAVIIHNFGEAAAMSDNLTSEHIRKKIKSVMNTPGRYFHAIIDPRNSGYMLTTFDIKQAYSNPTDFLNQLDHPEPTANETMVWDLAAKMFRGFTAPTPEGWAILENEKDDQQLFSFVQGRIWKHHNTNVPAINYYGVQCQPYIWAVCNVENTKEKRYLWNEVYCKEVKFYAYKITTSSGQESRIEPAWWDKRETFHTAHFLCDLNTKLDPNLPAATGPNKILDGDLLTGTWLMAAYTIKNYDGRFFKLTAIIIYIMGVEKSSSQ